MNENICVSCGVANMTADQLKALIKDAVREEFTACGLLASTDAEKVEMQEDFRLLRRFRRWWDALVNKVGTAVVFVFLAFVGGLIAIGFNLKYGK